jgi:hypothetical protein
MSRGQPHDATTAAGQDARVQQQSAKQAILGSTINTASTAHRQAHSYSAATAQLPRRYSHTATYLTTTKTSTNTKPKQTQQTTAQVCQEPSKRNPHRGTETAAHASTKEHKSPIQAKPAPRHRNRCPYKHRGEQEPRARAPTSTDTRRAVQAPNNPSHSIAIVFILWIGCPNFF